MCIFLPRITRINTDIIAGQCLGKPSCYGFSNPSTSELARDFETPLLILLRKWPCFGLATRRKDENSGLRLACQAGRCFEKASARPLVSVFYKTNPAFAQRLKPLFSIFLSAYILVIRG
jgi:hypothetical protein